MATYMATMAVVAATHGGGHTNSCECVVSDTHITHLHLTVPSARRATPNSKDCGALGAIRPRRPWPAGQLGHGATTPHGHSIIGLPHHCSQTESQSAEGQVVRRTPVPLGRWALCKVCRSADWASTVVLPVYHRASGQADRVPTEPGGGAAIRKHRPLRGKAAVQMGPWPPVGHHTARPLVHWATRLLGHRAVGALSQWITAQAGPKGSSAMRRFRTCAISGQVRNVTPCPWAAGPRRHWAIAPLGHCGIAGMLQLQHGSTDLPGHGAKRPGGNARSASRLREQWGTASRGRWDADQVGNVSSQPQN